MAKPFLVSFHALGKSTQAPPTLCFLQSKIQASSCSLKCSPVQDSLRGQTSSGPGSHSPSLVPGSSGYAELFWGPVLSSSQEGCGRNKLLFRLEWSVPGEGPSQLVAQKPGK